MAASQRTLRCRQVEQAPRIRFTAEAGMVILIMYMCTCAQISGRLQRTSKLAAMCAVSLLVATQIYPQNPLLPPPHLNPRE